MANGIELADATYDELRGLSEELGVALSKS